MTPPKERSRGNRGRRRCLIVERHAWETGFAKEQLQIPLRIAETFFGTADAQRPVTVRLLEAPSYKYACAISRRYSASGTRRINGLPFLGLLGPCFVFIQETEEADVFDLWCQYDMPVVAARFRGWTQARNSQHGRGRLAIIVRGPVAPPIVRIDK